MVPVFPISYFGSIKYFTALAKHKTVLIEAKEHFPKQSYRNRCDILSADGILTLSIPTRKHSGSKTPTNEILLSTDENWQQRHWRSIKTAYQSAPFFDYYGMEVEELLFNSEKNFLMYNLNITKRILKWIDIETTLIATSSFQPVIENDPRVMLTAKMNHQNFIPAPYIQVFPSKQSFTTNLSILDAVMCNGPLTRKLLMP